MKILEIVKSKLDNTQKYIFKTEEDSSIVEFSYINKDDGKDIICVPSQTMCNLRCKFCHTTDYVDKIKTRNLKWEEIYRGVMHIYRELELGKKTLLISFMGCGEPLLNVEEVVWSMANIAAKTKCYTRFAVATCIPKSKWLSFFEFTQKVKQRNLQVKLHLSLHYTMDQIRKEWMPASLDIIPSLSAADFYKKVTGNSVEIHYTLIEGVNDTEQDAILLTNYIKDKDFNVKFLFYNEREILDAKASPKEKIRIFRKYFDKYNIDHEYYIPVGLDIGASCGQFYMDYYVEHGGNINLPS